MRGTNPDGGTYADPVQFVAYFNGGDALHYMPRTSYGDPQSLGCVELPLTGGVDHLAVHDPGVHRHRRVGLLGHWARRLSTRLSSVATSTRSASTGAERARRPGAAGLDVPVARKRPSAELLLQK